MGTFAQWLEDFRWAMNVKRARAWRRDLGFSQRQAFDQSLRPPIKGENEIVVSYPDAFYHVKIDDLLRAMNTTRRWNGLPRLNS
jgi:hypothetical protein